MELIDLIGEINAKYLELDRELDRKLNKIKQDEERLSKLTKKSSNKFQSSHHQKILTLNEANIRNANLLKTFEIAKARLRSRSTFSPIEQILEKAIDNYKKDLCNTINIDRKKNDHFTNL